MSLLLNLFESRSGSIENPSTPISYEAALGGGSQQVNLDSALSVSAFFRGVSLISNAVGKVPIITYRRTDAGKVRAVDHPAYWLLKTNPNDNQTPKIFKQTLIAHAIVKGGGYAWIERDGSAKPLGLYILDPDKTTPVRVKNASGKKSKLWYVTELTGSDGETRKVKLRPMDVLHIPGLGWDGLNGWSLLKYGAISISDAQNTQKFTNKFYGNNTHLGVVLTVPEDTEMSVEERKELRRSWNEMQQGIDNVGKTAVLHAGITANQLTLNAQDAQLIESKKYSLVDLANWFGLPPHKLGDSSKSSYGSLEQENQSVLDEAYDPWMVTFEQECNKKLLTEDERESDSAFTEFLRIALIRQDAKTRAEVYSKALAGAPWMEINEVRRAENLNDSGEDFADTLLIPSNNFGDSTSGSSDSSDTSRALNRAATAAYKDATARVKKRLKLAYERNSKPIFWNTDYIEKHEAICREMLKPAIDMLEAISGECNLMDNTLSKIINKVQNNED